MPNSICCIKCFSLIILKDQNWEMALEICKTMLSINLYGHLETFLPSYLILIDFLNGFIVGSVVPYLSVENVVFFFFLLLFCFGIFFTISMNIFYQSKLR